MIILGATGTIGRSLVHVFAQRKRYKLILVGRNEAQLLAVAQAGASTGCDIAIASLDDVAGLKGDVIINCLGAGDPGTILRLGAELMHSIEAWDKMVLGHLERNPESLYIAFSSGVVYGLNRSEPVSRSTPAVIPINQLNEHHFYAVAKLNSELKHRTANRLNIVDLRVFGYISRFLDPDGGYFLSDVMAALRDQRALKTAAHDMFRDYVHPEDLCDLIELCAASRPLNRAFDVYSQRPITKFELLDTLGGMFGLQWHVAVDGVVESAASMKFAYYSINHDAETIGYQPQYSATEAVVSELEAYVATLGRRVRRAAGS